MEIAAESLWSAWKTATGSVRPLDLPASSPDRLKMGEA